jgi:hypothetical protein
VGSRREARKIGSWPHSQGVTRQVGSVVGDWGEDGRGVARHGNVESPFVVIPFES